jgi:hypothetical protein
MCLLLLLLLLLVQRCCSAAALLLLLHGCKANNLVERKHDKGTHV